MRLRILLSPLWLVFTIVVIAAAATCLGLGWWQWQRFAELGGTFQNLGYTIQWPFFAAFAVYLWWRLLRDAKESRAEASAADVQQPVGERSPAKQGVVELGVAERAVAETEVASGEAQVRTEEDDPELAAYNRYLASLHAKESA